MGPCSFWPTTWLLLLKVGLSCVTTHGWSLSARHCIKWKCPECCPHAATPMMGTGQLPVSYSLFQRTQESWASWAALVGGRPSCETTGLESGALICRTAVLQLPFAKGVRPLVPPVDSVGECPFPCPSPTLTTVGLFNLCQHDGTSTPIYSVLSAWLSSQRGLQEFGLPDPRWLQRGAQLREKCWEEWQGSLQKSIRHGLQLGLSAPWHHPNQ